MVPSTHPLTALTHTHTHASSRRTVGRPLLACPVPQTLCALCHVGSLGGVGRSSGRACRSLISPLGMRHSVRFPGRIWMRAYAHVARAAPETPPESSWPLCLLPPGQAIPGAPSSALPPPVPRVTPPRARRTGRPWRTRASSRSGPRRVRGSTYLSLLPSHLPTHPTPVLPIGPLSLPESLFQRPPHFELLALRGVGVAGCAKQALTRSLGEVKRFVGLGLSDI
ncbi:hypothetical protein CALCODRAFT_25774 [Calocera cornea HHB12733]|uniref:Uncharacterized protein n=1 Tax=Calocera cornea HHB12733 TaxID=1353952 RepID=A0A165J2Y8_9BASI|nr:hypothetical protein CALCODRAFT_25774 [Calocera cornea HHB12733]